MNDDEKEVQLDRERRGIDYDLRWCLRENPQGVFDVDDIDKVLAVWKGMNDEENWVWILVLNEPLFEEVVSPEEIVTPESGTAEDVLEPLLDAITREPTRVLLGRFVILSGGCDYTGWDCQSHAEHTVALTAVTAINSLFAWFNEQPDYAQSKKDASHLHVVHSELLRQLRGGKKMTWREQRDIEFGIGG